MRCDVVSLGELLVDFTGSGLSPQGNPLFEANPGGAPCNVLAMLAKLGKQTAFIGKVGGDMFGSLLKRAVAGAGIEAKGVAVCDTANTTLAFVQNTDDGDRAFSFFRNPGADTLLCAEDIDEELVKNSRIFHFGSLSLTHQPARAATQRAVALAKEGGALISFDPNLRPPLWADLGEARAQMLWGCAQCDILKVAEEELAFLSGIPSIGQGVAWLRQQCPQLRLVLVTKGKDGAEAFCNGLHAEKPAYLQAKAVDTTGAGDTFCGCCLAYVLEHGLDGLTPPVLDEMLLFANAAASLISAKKGALCVMPEKDDVLRLMGAQASTLS